MYFTYHNLRSEKSLNVTQKTTAYHNAKSRNIRHNYIGMQRTSKN